MALDEQVMEAISSAATAEDNSISRLKVLGAATTSSPERIQRVKRTIIRFLQECPEDATVFDLREALGDVP